MRAATRQATGQDRAAVELGEATVATRTGRFASVSICNFSVQALVQMNYAGLDAHVLTDLYEVIRRQPLANVEVCLTV